MKLYVTRHGQTDWNLNRKVSGISEIELNGTGRAQAHQTGEGLKGKGIDLIITSPLGRAVETGAIIAGIIGAPTAVDQRLHERDFGALEGTCYDDEAFTKHSGELAYKIGGGESVLQVAQRLYNLLDELPGKYPGKTILLVGHGAMMRVLHTYFGSYTNEEYAQIRTQNCEVREYEL